MCKKIIRVGADPFPPYQYFGEDGKPYGIDYEHVNKLFKAIGYEIELLIEDWPIIEKMLKKKELDAVFQVQQTPQRAAQYLFSGELRNAETQVITSGKTLTLGSLAEIPQKNLRLGLISGYVNGNEIDSLPAECKKFYPSTEKLLVGISQNEVDVGVFDKGVKEYTIEKLAIENIYVLDNMSFFRPLSVIFHDNTLRDAFDKALAAEQ